MQDGAPAHSAAVTLKQLKKEDRIEAYFGGRNSWPANSPDLDPIENCWAILKQNLSGKTYTDPETLFLEIETAWEHLSGEVLANLRCSMKRRGRLCIAAKGGHIKY